jgi:hypothetical protein
LQSPKNAPATHSFINTSNSQYLTQSNAFKRDKKLKSPFGKNLFKVEGQSDHRDGVATPTGHNFNTAISQFSMMESASMYSETKRRDISPDR